MDDIISHVIICQKKIKKYADAEDTERLVKYLSRLKHLPITVSHLEETGVGRSVNALRHCAGQVGERARSLVATWKRMVTAEESNHSGLKPGQGYAETASAGRQHSRKSVSTTSLDTVASIASPRPSKQQPPTQQSPDDYEDDDDGERLQIEEQPEGGVMDDECSPPPEDTYTPSLPSLALTGASSSNGASHGKYGLPVSCSDSENSPKYDPYTSQRDYESVNINSGEPAEYQPTPVDTPQLESGLESDVEQEEMEMSASAPADKSRHHSRKKHRSHNKEKSSSKDKHKHRSSDKDKDRSHKDKRKDKDRSPSKKRGNHSEKTENSVAESLDRRRSKAHKHENHEIFELDNSTDRSPVIDDNLLINGQDSLPDIVNLDQNKQISSSSKHKSPHKHLRSSGASSSKEHRKESKNKKDKKKDKDCPVDSSIREHKDKKRKKDEFNDSLDFGAALMGLDPSPVTKKKKSKSHHKDKEDRSSSKRSSNIDATESDKSHNISNDVGSSGSQVSLKPALLMLPPSQLDALSKINPNYKPLPRLPLPIDLDDDDNDLMVYPTIAEVQHRVPLMTQEEALEKIVSKGRVKRQIYSGKATGSSEVPSLFDLTIRFLQENIDAIETTGNVPYYLLKPVIERATAKQLFSLENYNSYLLEDTHELWEVHCKKDFKGHKPEEMETWRDLYTRLTDEREQKLQDLKHKMNIKFKPVIMPAPKVKIAYEFTTAKPPKSVARAQAKYGTGVPVGAPAKTTKAAEVLARKQAMANVARVERSSGASNGPAARTAAAKKPKAPLMAKTMQFYKKTFRR